MCVCVCVCVCVCDDIMRVSLFTKVTCTCIKKWWSKSEKDVGMLGVYQYVDLCFHHVLSPTLFVYSHAIPTSFYIFKSCKEVIIEAWSRGEMDDYRAVLLSECMYLYFSILLVVTSGVGKWLYSVLPWLQVGGVRGPSEGEWTDQSAAVEWVSG